jgi:diguanylate cyclase (GGDEF)-like protein/PAS domain S-box-containing protein
MSSKSLSDPAALQQPKDFEPVIKQMLQGMAGKMGADFLHALAAQLCISLKLDSALIGRWQDESKTTIQTLAVSFEGNKQENFRYSLANSVCQKTLEAGVYAIDYNAQSDFPKDLNIRQQDAQGYVGVTLLDSANNNIGIIQVCSKQGLTNSSLILSLLQIFAYRVSLELERQTIIHNLRDEVSINQAMLDSAPALMFMIDKEGNFLRWNEYYRSKMGYSKQDILELNVLGLIHENDRLRVKIEIEKVFSVGSGSLYINGLSKSGEIVPLLSTAQVAEYDGNKVIVGVALDMTEQQKVEHNLLRSQGRLAKKNSHLSMINELVDKLHASHSVQRIADKVVDILKTIERGALLAFSLIDETSQIIQVVASHGINKELLKKRTSFSIELPGSPTAIAIRSKQLEIFKHIDKDKRLTSDIHTLVSSEKIQSGLAIPLIHQDKTLGCIVAGFRYDSDFSDDEIEFFKTIGASISLALANALQYERMESLATQDSLTELPNRNALNYDSQIALTENAKLQSYLGLILIDLDRFKEINDTLDHQIGDKLLKVLGPRIEVAVNDYNSTVYRIGGDEFCVLVKRKQNIQQINKIAHAINQAIERVFIIDGLNLEISSSIGVVTCHGSQFGSNELLRCAELAMYHAKEQGSGIASYSPELDADTQQRFVIMAEMAEAIRTDQLVLHYQPKFDLKTRKITGCEALVRWQHKSYGLLPPAKFIPLIELTQLIHPLTFWVMKTAMQQLKIWQSQGINIDIAINLSTRNLTDENFVAEVDSLIHEYEIDPKNLEFEVTETALIGNLEKATEQLQAFKSRGIQCSLDDYGTGYSSLSYIKKLPLDILKIDRSFITAMLEDNSDSIIAQSTIDLAHNLGMKVIAEGVENKETLEKLFSQNCDMVQGYFICEPVDAQSLADLYWQEPAI